MTKKQLRWDVVVFDWDGTIADTTSLITKGMRATCLAMGYPDPGADCVLSTIGLSRAESMQQICPDCPMERWQEFYERYFSWYRSEEAVLDIRDGMRELFQTLSDKGYRLAIATGKSRVGLNRVLDQFNCAEYFEVTRTGDDTFSKPNPAMLMEISDEMGVMLKRMVMVGDSEHDLLMAKNAGCDAIGILGGASSEKVLKALPNIALVRNTEELAQVLE